MLSNFIFIYEKLNILRNKPNKYLKTGGSEFFFLRKHIFQSVK